MPSTSQQTISPSDASGVSSRKAMIAQMLGGLMSGYLRSYEDQRANPRMGFSYIPIAAGLTQGALQGLAARAAQAEKFRQEQDQNAQTYGLLSLLTGQAGSDLQRQANGARFGKIDGGTLQSIANSMANANIARQYGLQNPEAYRGGATSTIDQVFQQAGAAQRNLGSLDQLPTAQAAGEYAAGGNTTPNALQYPNVPTLGALIPGTRAAIAQAMANAKPGQQIPIPVAGYGATAPVAAAPTGAPAPAPSGYAWQATPYQQAPLRAIPQAPAGLETDPNIYALSAQQSAPPVPAVPMYAPANMQAAQPMMLADLLRAGANPQTVVNAYTQGAQAANQRNVQDAGMWKTAQQQSGANQRSIASYLKPTQASIIAEGSPQAFNRLMQVQKAGLDRARAAQGLDKPVTRSEQLAMTKYITSQSGREDVLSATRLAVENGSLPASTALDLANSTLIGDGENPISAAELYGAPAPQAPAAVYPGAVSVPGLPGVGASFLPSVTDIINGGGRMPVMPGRNAPRRPR